MISLSQGDISLTFSLWSSLSYRNQSIDLQTNQWTRCYMVGTSVMKDLKTGVSFSLFTRPLTRFSGTSITCIC